MTDRMRARGPDAKGSWIGDDGLAAMGHRRLAVVDLDTRSNQPMVSADGCHVIVFNGEIYNFRSLRAELEGEGETFGTTGDTEVLLKLYARHGAAMMPMLRGMFAFAIWDVPGQSLFCARDPYGIKPLYVGRFDSGWLVASAVKAILATSLVSKAPSAAGRAGFWLMGSVPEPHTWFRDIESVPAGSWMRISPEGAERPVRYWDIGDAWRNAPDVRESESRLRDIVRQTVTESVDFHLVSDVPIGVFLSGGVDSGTIAGLMRAAHDGDILSATVAFDEFVGQTNDEAPRAKILADAYGIRAHVRRVARQEFQADLPAILDAMDQPSIDGVNTWFAAKATAELGLKVAVSGIGGDEIFFGYPGFRQIPALVRTWRVLRRFPGMRLFAESACRWRASRSGIAKWGLLPNHADSLQGAYYLRRGLFTPDDLPRLMGKDLAREAGNDASPESIVAEGVGELAGRAELAVGQMESMLYLRNQLLRDSDWASMAHSLELRTPLVDAWLLREMLPALGPLSKIDAKRILAAAPEPPVPASIVERPKTGFGLPLREWIESAIEAPGSAVSKGRPGAHAAAEAWAEFVARSVYA